MEPTQRRAPGRSGILTKRQRQVLRLQAYGLTYQEISEQLGLSIWTVKNHHKQAVQSLRVALKDGPVDRVRTSLACYILGLLDGGLTPQEVAQRLSAVTPVSPSPNGEESDAHSTRSVTDSSFAAD